MKYRKAEEKDILNLIKLRKKQLIDEGIAPSIDIDEELEKFFIEKFKDNTLSQFLIEENEEIIATAAIIFYQFPPTYTNKTGVKGYVTNVFTKNEHRGKGYATFLLDKVVEEAQKRKVKNIWLGASKLGRPVYERYGFKAVNKWLELNLD